MTREDFDKAMSKGYRDRFGFPVGNQGEIINPSGNCLMFLAEEIIIRRDLGRDQAAEDLDRFLELTGLCQLQPGNFRRTPLGCPFSLDQEGWDDFLGITAAAAVLTTQIVSIRAFNLIAQIVLFGRSHFYRWKFLRIPYAFATANPAPVETTVFPACFGRYLQLVAHFRWCVGERPNIVQRFVWCWSVAFAGFFDVKGQDPWRISYLQVRALKASKIWFPIPEHFAVMIWRWRFLRNWPGGIRDVRARYFNDPNHPLAKFASMEF